MFTSAEITALVHREADGGSQGELHANTQALGGVLRDVWTDAYLTGVHAAMESDGITFTTKKAAGPTNTMSYAAGIDWNTWTPGDPAAALKVADGGLRGMLDQINVVLDGITQTTVDRIGNIIGQGLDAGSSVDSMSRSINTYLNDPARSDLIATTEANRAQTTAQSDTLQSVGFSQFDWISYDGACDDCLEQEDNNPHDFGDDEPPGHPACRCSITGSVEQADQIDPNIDIPAPDNSETQPTPVEAAASSPNTWADGIKEAITNLGAMPDNVIKGADGYTPGADMHAWVDGAKEIGQKISQQIEDTVAQKSGLSLSDAQTAWKKANDEKIEALRTAQDAWQDRMIRDYQKVEPGFPTLPSEIAARLGLDSSKNFSSWYQDLARALYERIPNGVADELKAEYKAYIDAEDKATELTKMEAKARDAMKQVEATFHDAVFEVLNQVREMGGVDVNFADKLSSTAARRIVVNNTDSSKALNDLAQRIFPKEWLETSNTAGQTVINRVENRGWAETVGIRGKSEVNTVVNSDATERLMAHEFMHRMEYVVDGISRAEWTFLHQRVEGVRGRVAQSLRTLCKGNGYRADEIALKDDFKNAYSGKFYNPFGGDSVSAWRSLAPDERTAFEVMTTGFEDLVTGVNNMGITSGTDPEFKAFLLGVLAAL